MYSGDTKQISMSDVHMTDVHMTDVQKKFFMLEKDDLYEEYLKDYLNELLEETKESANIYIDLFLCFQNYIEVLKNIEQYDKEVIKYETYLQATYVELTNIDSSLSKEKNNYSADAKQAIKNLLEKAKEEIKEITSIKNSITKQSSMNKDSTYFSDLLFQNLLENPYEAGEVIASIKNSMTQQSSINLDSIYFFNLLVKKILSILNDQNVFFQELQGAIEIFKEFNTDQNSVYYLLIMSEFQYSQFKLEISGFTKDRLQAKLARYQKIQQKTKIFQIENPLNPEQQAEKMDNQFQKFKEKQIIDNNEYSRLLENQIHSFEMELMAYLQDSIDNFFTLESAILKIRTIQEYDIYFDKIESQLEQIIDFFSIEVKVNYTPIFKEIINHTLLETEKEIKEMQLIRAKIDTIPTIDIKDIKLIDLMHSLSLLDEIHHKHILFFEKFQQKMSSLRDIMKQQTMQKEKDHIYLSAEFLIDESFIKQIRQMIEEYGNLRFRSKRLEILKDMKQKTLENYQMKIEIKNLFPYHTEDANNQKYTTVISSIQHYIEKQTK